MLYTTQCTIPQIIYISIKKCQINLLVNTLNISMQ